VYRNTKNVVAKLKIVLQDTRENLQRVEDILRELNANLEKLQSQADVAQKFNVLQGEQEEKAKTALAAEKK
jgi:chromosome segregation ATPase